MKREQIFLSKNFTVIESDIPFTLKFNVKDNTANSAEDVINFKSGWYIFDNNKLLPQYVDGVYNLPKYNCWIEFDDTLSVTPPHWYTCYINPKSVESLSAEQTELDPAQLALLRQDIQINGSKVDNFAAATHSDLGAVKSSVDALQTSNHSDLGAVKSSVDAFKSALLDGVPGFSEPLRYYFEDSIRFTKEVRNVISPNPVGFHPSWDHLVTEVSLGQFGGVFLPYDCSLLFKLCNSGVVVGEYSFYLPSGAYDISCNAVSHDYVLSVNGVSSFSHTFSGISAADQVMVFSHFIDVYY